MSAISSMFTTSEAPLVGSGGRKFDFGSYERSNKRRDAPELSNKVVVKKRRVDSEMEESDTDEEMLDCLMQELLNETPNFHLKKNREGLPKTTKTCNLKNGPGGLVNYRDGTVLGKQTGIRLPKEFADAERVHIAIYLATGEMEDPCGKAALVPMPPFFHKHLCGTSKLMSRKWSLAENEAWVNPKELGPDLDVEFQKRKWSLSQWYRKICNQQWPKFVFVVTAHMPKDQKTYSISPEFEVRSKEQSNKAMASLGYAAPVHRRRTPETEKREERLRALRADIMNVRDTIRTKRAMRAQNSNLVDFVSRILETCSSRHARKMSEMCKQHKMAMAKWQK